MGGVWCKVDRSQRTYSNKQPFNTALSRWTDHVRQAYRKPKQHHRPPRPPQKPARSSERLTISAPTLVTQASSDGWRTATLVVPETQVAPVPPPRKKRKRNKDLNRSAVSMDDLNLGSSEYLSKSTISLPDKCSSDTPDSRGSSSTLIVTPILEPRNNHGGREKEDEKKENMKNNLHKKIEEEEEEEDEDILSDQPEIIPIENETFFSARTFLHSNLGYVDKLSAISEVSAESGFEDKTDNLKFSEGSGSVTSIDSVHRETLNILAHIHDINNVSQVKDNVDVILPSANDMEKENSDITEDIKKDTKQVSQTKERGDVAIGHIQNTDNTCQLNGNNEVTHMSKNIGQAEDSSFSTLHHAHATNNGSHAKENSDIKEKNAVSKKEWLQNILKVDPEPYFMSRDESKERRGSEDLTKPAVEDVTGQPNSLPNHLHLMKREKETTAEEINNTSPSTPVKPPHPHDNQTNHSVLLDIIQNNKESESDTPNFFNHREESIFLTNTKTHIIYKSLSSDKLTDYDTNYSGTLAKTVNGRRYSGESDAMSLASNSRLSDYSFQTPKLVESDSGLNSLLQDKRSNVITTFDFKEIKVGKREVSEIQRLNSPSKSLEIMNNSAVGSVEMSLQNDLLQCSEVGKPNDKTSVKEALVKKDSISSSRKSSITDSLHEFEMSIYDMLKESKKNENSSDEEESLKTLK